MLDNRRSQADTSEILPSQFSNRDFQKFRDKFNLRLGDPDVSFPWPGAASPTLYAFKMQTPYIPRCFFLRRHLTTSGWRRCRRWSPLRRILQGSRLLSSVRMVSTPFFLRYFSLPWHQVLITLSRIITSRHGHWSGENVSMALIIRLLILRRFGLRRATISKP